jgi:arylformamidase
MPLIDISIPITDGMITWPGDPPVSVIRTADLACGDACRVSRLSLGSHTGTHVDAFSHFKPDGAPLDQMPLEPFIGPVLVLDMPARATLSQACLAEALAPYLTHTPYPLARLILKTDNSKTLWHQQPFNRDFVHLLPEAAQHLASLDIRLVGVDYLSIDGFHTTAAPCHHILMDAKVHILEGLLLQHVSPGWYELLCLPMPLANGDGAPARTVLRTLP